MRARVSSSLIAATVVVGLGLLSSGCLDRELKPLNPCTRSGVVEKIRVTSVDKVDLLFMVDNSNSMTEEQVSLAREFPRLITVLATGDKNPDDGIEEGIDFPPIRSLQVGVITSDMGTGGFMVPTCLESNFGDDGALRTQGNTAIGTCSATYPSFLSFMPGSDPDAFATDVSCVAVVGTGGCGFEQQLEATLKAVTPALRDGMTPAAGAFNGSFNMGSTGHAHPDGRNAGFVRQDSLLAAVLVTDEEDCSALDPEVFNPMSAIYSGDLNLRCYNFPEAVFPTQRYVDGLLATRTSPDLLVYAIIAGIPPDLIVEGTPNYGTILADPRMQEDPDLPDNPNRLRPSCNVPGRGLAFPPRRLVQVAEDLNTAGAAGIVQSICQDSFTPALDAIIDKIADVLGGACLPRELNPLEDGTVNCDVIEILPVDAEFTRCDQIAGREFVSTDTETGGQICRVTQLAATGGVAPTEPGWYYDNFSPDVLARCGDSEAGVNGQRISFTSGNEPKTGTLVRLECLQPVQATGGDGVIAIYTPCDPAVDTTACVDGQTIGDRRCDGNLICDPEEREWQPTCDSDANCPAGFRCIRDRTDEAGTALPNICINPTCG